MSKTNSGGFDIANVIDERLIALDLDVTTKEGMLEELVDRLEQHGRISDREGFLNDVMWREGEGKTGIGMGVAIPHGKSSGVTRTALAIGTTKHPLAWESLDDEPVHVVILFAVTEGDSDIVHLKLLQHVAMLLAHEAFVERLHKTRSACEMIELLESSPDDYDS
ncbi:putative PTS IIA-like nitrogen-regulatory protein PtsN [Coriobacterium glomerans PW2]|uniref:PTS IIA-like nitrogen-regulatory protein PtsN n=1 Tax=Coriobacterium glomerans (strain ATCC 49209 / DSM 20642 / JCM 10262 / PW2) TaxID=700015 RepID=F2NAY1_CORGP|nr:PTS sugar transporter subunit IIA [Coriobacterium glomerans]AEB07659.1 putative PTS IIA-like nitrogen-regulatory protein PtsN [Coriobacterium glomerans PW2]